MEPSPSPTRYEQALTRLALAIRDNPDTGGGVQLRRFLWSLYNQYHLVNLWTLVSRLDEPHSALVAEVISAALVGNLKESDLKRALLVAGEMKRWDADQPSTETLQRFEEAEHTIEALVRSVPPGRPHTELSRLLQNFTEVKAALKESPGGPA